MKKKIVRNLVRAILAAYLFAILFAIIEPNHGAYSGLPDKSGTARFELNVLQSVADNYRDVLAKMENPEFTKTFNPGGSLWMYNQNGELLDPWGLPFAIRQTEKGQFKVVSPGLERHEKMSWWQKLSDGGPPYGYK